MVVAVNLVEACLGECASLLVGIFVDFFFFFGFFCGLIFWFDSLWVVGGLSCRVGLLDVGI